MIVISHLFFYFGRKVCGFYHKSNECARTIIASDEAACDDLAAAFLSNLADTQIRIIGFDCEWVTDGKERKPVALVQMSAQGGLCGLFRINLLKNMPLKLKSLLEDPSILKVGVSPLTDAGYLLQDQGVVVRGCIDLRHLSGNDAGLAALAKTFLKTPIDKDKSLRCSDWEAEVLDKRQVAYAALDARLALKLFWVLLGDRKLDVCYKFVDLPYKNQFCSILKKKSPPSAEDASRPTSSLYTIKKPVYDRVFIQKPDGSTLIACSAKKANWYLMKDLAVKICDDPLTIRLTFEPKAPSVENNEDVLYYTEVKENHCVVCGDVHGQRRKNIVPIEYRKHFPVDMKKHLSHDVLPMCSRCHGQSARQDNRLRFCLMQQCGAPFSNDQMVLVPERVNLIKAARTILNPSGVSPDQLERCHSIIVDYVERLDYDNGTLADIAHIHPRKVTGLGELSMCLNFEV